MEKVEGEMKSKKRKKKQIEKPAKRQKSEYSERFKFVLAPSPNEVDPQENANKRKTTKCSTIFESPSDSSVNSEDESWLDDDLESLSDEEEEEFGEEWETDTDFSNGSSEYSFHESDCDEIQSSDDSDYEPPFEDKYIKKGEASIYDAKGLDIAFGDTSDSQIVEISDLNIDLNDNDDDAPMLVDENGREEVPTVCQIDTLQAEEEEEELVIEFSQLLQRVTFYDCSSDQGVVICLSKTIHFLGILEIRPLLNSVQVNGYTINTGESLKVTSISHANFYLNLSPIINGCEIDGLKNELTKLVPESAEDIISKLDREKDVLVHLKQGLPDTSVEILKTYSPYAILPHKSMILKNSASSTSELILSSRFFVSDENPKLNCFRVNEDWKYIEMKSDSRIVVVGGKNTGKSTLAQYLINQNISKFGKILLIDFDIGQPICGISQTVSCSVVTESLIGAGCISSNIKLAKSLLFGDKSITNEPFKYVKCASLLTQFCQSQEELQGIPWVINTMGYQKGFGIQLLSVIIRIVQPSDIVQIQHENSRYNYDSIIDENCVNKSTLSFFEENHIKNISKEAFFTTHILTSLVNNSIHQNEETAWISNATEKRKMSLLAHLSKLLRSGQTFLNEAVPFRVEIDRVRMIIIDEEYENEQATTQTKLELFNGNLIYLCSDSSLESSILECHGVGLVRAIDKIHGHMYILFPQEINEKLRSVVNVVAIANIPLPSDILLKQNFKIFDDENIPYVTFFKSRGAKKYINKRNIKDCY